MGNPKIHNPVGQYLHQHHGQQLNHSPMCVGLPSIHVSTTDSSITSASRLPCLVLWPLPLFHLKSETLTTRTSDRVRHRLVKKY